jgi:hypothetical protein
MMTAIVTSPDPGSAIRRVAWLGTVGMFAAVLWGFATYWMLQDRLDALSRTTVPGQVTIQASAPERVTIFFEDPSAPRGFLVRSASVTTLTPAPVDVVVTGPAGRVVTASPYERDLRFAHDGRVVIAMATIRVPVTGSYTIDVGGTVPPGTMVSVGTVLDGVVMVNAGGVVVLFVVSALAVLVAKVAAAVQRRRVPSGAGRSAATGRAADRSGSS